MRIAGLQVFLTTKSTKRHEKKFMGMALTVSLCPTSHEFFSCLFVFFVVLKSFLQQFFDEGDIFGHINSDAAVLGHQYPDSGAIFEGSELFEHFAVFQHSLWPVDKLLQEFAGIGIQSPMQQRFDFLAAVAREWNQ